MYEKEAKAKLCQGYSASRQELPTQNPHLLKRGVFELYLSFNLNYQTSTLEKLTQLLFK